jgi:uncharacterized protein YdeI (YjbR/CyaY-like superfamily)
MKQLIYKELPVVSFISQDEFYTWLGTHNDTQQPFWLRYYKKGTGIPCIVHGDAVDVALCWGWIDGLLNKYDEQSYVVRYTPRRKKSVWSKINVEKVALLTAQGRMQPSGLAHVEAAKADGRWDAAYAGQATIEIPASFVRKLAAHPQARAVYDSLTKTQKYPYAFKLATVIGEERREKLEETLLQELIKKSSNVKS